MGLANSSCHFLFKCPPVCLQPGEYVKGKRVKQDEPRKLYKLFQALLLEALVSEVPVVAVIKTFFPCSHLAEEAAVSRHLKEVKDLQVPVALAIYMPLVHMHCSSYTECHKSLQG
jgi:hypothetical protein